MRGPPRLRLLALLSLPAFFLFFLCLVWRPTGLFPTTGTLPDEIFGLLHFVTSPDEAGRVITTPGSPSHESPSESGVQLGGPVAPDQPVEMAWYALGAISRTAERAHRRVPAGGWGERLKVLRDEYPLVVFSKSYCPYSERAKRLLEAYELTPRPKIIEVDLRADAAHIKAVLTRLTDQTTFPNVILHGRSLGGSQDLSRLHREGRLRRVLEEGGVEVRWAGDKGLEGY